MADTPTGCSWDAATAKIVRGKNVVALVLDETGTDLLAISGQQSLSFSLELSTSELESTKDSDGDWQEVLADVKSWSASVDGLASLDDDAQKKVVTALANGDMLCLWVAEREITDTGVTYTPIRSGMALVTSHELSAETEDATTYSMEFTGSGKPWLRELHTADEIAAAAVTITNS